MATEKSVIALIRASRPSFRNNHDKIAFAVHASFLAAGYVLTATGPPAFTESALSSTSTDEVGIEQWNEFDDEYAFVYVNPEKGNKKVLVKCLVMGDKLVVDALSNGGPEPVHLEVSTDDYIGEDGATNYAAQYKNLGKLLSGLNSNVLSKLDGPAPAAGSSRNDATSSRSSRDSDRPAVMVTEPEDIPHVPGVVHPPINPLGGGDLYPGAGAGMYPTRGNFGGGSMLVGPDDPRWFGGGIGGDQSGFPGGFGGGIGGDQSGFPGGFGGGIRGDQPGFPGAPGVPPGARFDPYGPPGVPGFEPNRFTRLPRRPGGGNHPDLEQPGRDDFI